MALSIVLIVVAIVAVGVVQLAAVGIVRRNSVAGIRTHRLLADDASWRAGHRAAAPWMWLGGILCVGLAIVSTLPSSGATVRGWLPVAAVVSIIVFGVIGTVRADRAVVRAGAPARENDPPNS